jgi:hypothetical protein
VWHFAKPIDLHQVIAQIIKKMLFSVVGEMHLIQLLSTQHLELHSNHKDVLKLQHVS